MPGEKLSSDSQSIEGYLKDVKILVESEGYTEIRSIIVMSQDCFGKHYLRRLWHHRFKKELRVIG